jgi:hypothetical protein
VSGESTIRRRVVVTDHQAHDQQFLVRVEMIQQVVHQDDPRNQVNESFYDQMVHYFEYENHLDDELVDVEHLYVP